MSNFSHYKWIKNFVLNEDLKEKLYDTSDEELNDWFESIIMRLSPNPEIAKREIQGYNNQGYQGFSDELRSKLSRDMDWMTYVQYTHDMDQYARETGGLGEGEGFAGNLGQEKAFEWVNKLRRELFPKLNDEELFSFRQYVAKALDLSLNENRLHESEENESLERKIETLFNEYDPYVTINDLPHLSKSMGKVQLIYRDPIDPNKFQELENIIKGFGYDITGKNTEYEVDDDRRYYPYIQFEKKI